MLHQKSASAPSCKKCGSGDFIVADGIWQSDIDNAAYFLEIKREM